MPPPTLFIKGKLRAPTGDAKEQQILDSFIPIDYLVEWFKRRQYENGIKNRVLVLKSQTGSGKSTGVPAELFRHFIRNHKGPGIICTQPRTITAIRNVPQIVYESGPDYPTFLKIGETIGWSTKFNKLRPRSPGILSATIGTLTQQLSIFDDDQIMALYKFILIDEVHERDLQTDMTLYMLKNFIIRNQNNIKCPFVVLMSATFDPYKFTQYFEVDPRENFIWCEGRSYGIASEWNWAGGKSFGSISFAAAAAVEKILQDDTGSTSAAVNAIDKSISTEANTAEMHDILIFMPGLGEIMDTATLLHRLNKQLAPQHVLSILQVDSDSLRLNKPDYRKIDIPLHEQVVKIDGKDYKPTRRVVISTNVAETGITIKSLKYVIDSGYNKEIEFNPNFGIRGLLTRPAPRSRIQQRMGRVGRLFYGHFYPLYSEAIYNSVGGNQLPQILVEDISPIMLRIICEQLRTKKLAGKSQEFKITDIDMLDIPAPDSLHYALEKMFALGFIDIGTSLNDAATSRGGFTLSKLGEVATLFNMISPESIRMILGGYSWGCYIGDLVTIAAYLITPIKEFVIRSESSVQKNINWELVYNTGAPRFLTGDGELYRVRSLVADEFIDGIIIYSAVKQIIAKDLKMAMVNLQKWCDAANIKYDAIINFVRDRDGILEQMISNEMDVFQNADRAFASCNIDNFMDTVARIKYCIYDGHRLNIARWDGAEYKIIGGAAINTPKLFRIDEEVVAKQVSFEFITKLRPQNILYNSLELKLNRKTSMYAAVVDRISVMDGFVHVDFSPF